MGKRARLKKLRKMESKIVRNDTKVYDRTHVWQYLAYIAVILSLIYLAFTVIHPGFFPSGHDIGPHYGRAKVFVTALNQGQFPVRWVNWIQEGTGHPMFNYYNVGFYYLVAIVNTIIPSLNISIQLTVLLLWWLGSIFIYLFSRRFGNVPALASALIFAFSPYIISDVFVRAAYPELAAIVFSIGSLWALDRLLRTARVIYTLCLSIFLAFVPVSHLPTLVIMVPVLISYPMLLLIIKEVKPKGIFFSLIAGVLAGGLGAFYLLPALLELKYIKQDLLTSGYYDFHAHFVYLQQIFSTFWDYGKSLEGPNDGMSFQFGVVSWIIIALAIGSLFINRLRHNVTMKQCNNVTIIFWLLFILYAIFFMHEVSLSFWENIKPITYAQYPWRFLMIAAISTAILSAVLTSSIPKKLYQSITVLIAVILVFIFYSSYLKPSVYIPNDFFKIDSDEWRKSQGIALNPPFEQGYVPAAVQELPEGDIGRWSITGNNSEPKVKETITKDHYLSFTTESEKQFGLVLHSFYFPGWKAYIDEQETKISYNNKYTFMVIDVPPGIHKITAKFTDTPIRSASNKITVFSFFLLVAWQAISATKSKIYAKI